MIPSLKIRRTSSWSERSNSRIKTWFRFSTLLSSALGEGEEDVHICEEETIIESFLVPAMASCSSATILVSQTILGDEQCMQLAWNELKLGRSKKNKRWMMVFFVMERKKTDVLLQPWASSRPRLAGASQVVFIMRQSRIQILGCGCSPHLADWMRRGATSRRWEVKAQKTQRNVSFWNTIFLPPSVHRRNSSHVCVFGGSEPMASCDALWRAMSPACDCSTSSVTTMLRNISLHASTIHFTLRVQMLTGFIHWHFTNARWTAYECVRVTLLLHCNAALWFTFIQPTPFFLGPKISVVVTSVRLLGMFSQSLMNMSCSVFGLIYSRVQYIYIYRSVRATNFRIA